MLYLLCSQGALLKGLCDVLYTVGLVCHNFKEYDTNCPCHLLKFYVMLSGYYDAVAIIRVFLSVYKDKLDIICQDLMSMSIFSTCFTRCRSTLQEVNGFLK